MNEDLLPEAEPFADIGRMYDLSEMWSEPTIYFESAYYVPGIPTPIGLLVDAAEWWQAALYPGVLET